MSLYDYIQSQRPELQEVPYYTLIMVAMRRADNNNEAKLRAMWPNVWDELYQRYHAPAGLLPGECDNRRGIRRLESGEVVPLEEKEQI